LIERFCIVCGIFQLSELVFQFAKKSIEIVILFVLNLGEQLFLLIDGLTRIHHNIVAHHFDTLAFKLVAHVRSLSVHNTFLRGAVSSGLLLVFGECDQKAGLFTADTVHDVPVVFLEVLEVLFKIG